MGLVRDIFTNRVLLAGLVAWLIAQVLKTILYALIHKKLDFSRLVGDGGMPSGHSATVSAVATMCALTCGADSPVFAVSFILATITCHDAMNSRQQIGKQAAVLNQLVQDMLHGEKPEIVLKELVGHTRSQVCAGILLGILTGYAMYYYM